MNEQGSAINPEGIQRLLQKIFLNEWRKIPRGEKQTQKYASEISQKYITYENRVKNQVYEVEPAELVPLKYMLAPDPQTLIPYELLYIDAKYVLILVFINMWYVTQLPLFPMIDNMPDPLFASVNNKPFVAFVAVPDKVLKILLVTVPLILALPTTSRG